jgi:hypothetical protein
MSERITQKDLEAACGRINRAVGIDPDAPLWTRGEDGKNHQTPGMYHLSGAYGGYSLHRSSDADSDGESHGIDDVFRCGHIPKRELYYRMQAFLDGIDVTSSAR